MTKWPHEVALISGPTKRHFVLLSADVCDMCAVWNVFGRVGHIYRCASCFWSRLLCVCLACCN